MKWWIWLIIIFVLVLMIIGRTKKRGYFWKKKDGTTLTIKQFLKEWGKGIDGITPIQITFSQLLGNYIVLAGIISGIIVNALVRMENVWWWVEIILVGSLLLTLLAFLGTLQKYRRIKLINKQMKELECSK